MEGYSDQARLFILNGSDEKENIERRVAFLTALYNSAERKEIYIGQLRQRNMNYALVAFAGLFTVGLSLPTKLYSFLVSVALLAIVAVFCLLDHRFHKLIHGWRKSQRMLSDRVSQVINDPAKDITVARYAVSGEKEVEPFHLQPIIFYCLVIGGVAQCVSSFISWITA